MPSHSPLPLQAPTLSQIQQAAELASLAFPQEPPAHRSAPRMRPGMFCKKTQTEGERESFLANNSIFLSLFDDNEKALSNAIQRDPEGVNRPIHGDIKASLNYTPLHLACYQNNERAVRALMAAGGNAALFSGGVTPMGLAVYVGADAAVRVMIEHGADARLELLPEHAMGSGGSTVLHRALERPAYLGRFEVVKSLILSGQYPDPLPRTELGITPLDNATDGDCAAAWLRLYAATLEGLLIKADLSDRPLAQRPSAKL